jgi:hypothetical protein
MRLSLRRFLPGQSSWHPLKERWEYFLKQPQAVPTAIALVESVADHQLRDSSFLEHELIPAIGLNDENSHEQPPELSGHFGKGLHVFQYPNQFAPYMAWMADHAQDIHSYLEVGTRWGGTFILTCEWLRRIGAPLQTAIAIDPIGETPMLQTYGAFLASGGIHYRFVQDVSTSPAVQALFAEQRPEFVFIDGDHSMTGALADHMLARQSARILVHHDVASLACPETTALWKALKELECGLFTAEDFTQQYPSVDGSFLGIGVLKKRENTNGPDAWS